MDHQEIEANNLVERYVLGRLTVDEQIRFEEHFAGCPACTEEVELAEELATGLGEMAAEDARMMLGGGLLALLVRRARWVAPLGIAFVVVPLFWLVTQNASLRSDLAELRQPLVNVPTFLLDVNRDSAAPVPVLEIPEGRAWLALSIEVDPIGESIHEVATPESYAAALEDASGQVLWQASTLEPNPWGVLFLTLPRELLPPGEYRLVVSATGEDGVEPLVTVYPFRLG